MNNDTFFVEFFFAPHFSGKKRFLNVLLMVSTFQTIEISRSAEIQRKCWIFKWLSQILHTEMKLKIRWKSFVC